MGRFLLAIFVALLAACAGPAKKPPEITPHSWAEHAAAVAALEAWTAQGKLALRTSQYVEAARMEWRQQGRHSTIQLSGPAGLNATLIEHDGRRLAISSGDEQHVWDVSSPDALARETGWELPLNALPHWLKGVPAPGSDIQLLELDEDEALLQHLRQNDWEVRYEDYGAFAPYTLPTRLRIQRGTTSARVIIRDWQFPES